MCITDSAVQSKQQSILLKHLDIMDYLLLFELYKRDKGSWDSFEI